MKHKRSEIRAALIATRRAIEPTQRKQWDREIVEQVLDWCSANPAQIIAAYSPIQAEPSLAEIFPELVARGIRLALPIAPAPDQKLIFSSWAPGEPLMKDRYGILVPMPSAPVVHPDVLLVPCVGYTAQGYRLGYGGGFYDRTLVGVPRPKTLGIAYRFGLCDMEIEAHDVPLDIIITNR